MCSLPVGVEQRVSVDRIAAQVNALNPVISRPTSRVWIVSVPSNV
jgi:hypothetical protein